MIIFFAILNYLATINGDYLDNSTLVLYEDANYLGCFNDHFLRVPQYHETSDDNFNISKCFEICRNQNFSFAGTFKIGHFSHRCICENRFATRMINQTFCEYQCKGDETTFCGGLWAWSRFYSLKNRSTSYELHLNNIEIHLFRATNRFSTSNNWNSSILAAKKCVENKNYSFSSLINNDFYACLSEDDLIESIDIQNFKNITNDTKIDYDESEHEIDNVYLIEKKKISIDCPPYININESVECQLNAEFFDDFLDIEIDFNDGEIQIYKLDNGIHFFKKIYNISGLFTINVRIKNKEINLNPLIYVKQDFTSLNWTDNSSISNNDYHNYYQYMGCFFNQWNIYPDSDNFIIENSKFKIDCLEECKKKNYTYSIINHSQCLCTNKYGLYGLYHDQHCECICVHSNDEYCGCGGFEMVYKLKGTSEFSTTRASFKGCFYVDSVPNSYFLGQNTVSLCLKYCIKKNAKFFAISNGFECFCENENNFGLQVDTRLCDIKCPGNSSEICGGYFGLMSLYEITYASIVLTTANKEIMINQSFKLNFKFNEIPFEEIMYFTIEFGDGDTKIVIYSEIDSESFQEQNVVVIKRHNENSISEISIEKEYQDIGPHSIRVYNKEEINILSIDILIRSNETIYSGFEQKFIFIYENGDYVGCFWNIDYDQINYHLLVKNQEICAAQCTYNGYLFSATQNHIGRACLCRSSYPIYQNRSSCYCACPYSNHRFCGCHDFTRLYKIQVNTTKTSMIGIYSGCFLISPIFKKDIEIGFLNNDVCILYCNENNYSYAATKMGLKFI
ncbi:transmembrane receptor [Brachionus plicatilis]|uniref:Transmembrane receptor n=1 Tax=Brachionus plicatilis TaxID=10195 RepID=A0A3M7QNV3_BRAPC|nr:transmembrane receptor [Brachionus plicatilis]